MNKTVWRAVTEIGFIIFLFYSNLLMGEFERSGAAQGRGFTWALADVFTVANFGIATGCRAHRLCRGRIPAQATLDSFIFDAEPSIAAEGLREVRRVARIGRRRLVGAAEPRSPVRTLPTTRRSRGRFGDGRQCVLLVMGDPNGTDHRVGDRRGKNLRPAVGAIQTARAFRSSAPDTGRTLRVRVGGTVRSRLWSRRRRGELEGVRGDFSRRLRAPRSVIDDCTDNPDGACRDPTITE